MKGRHTTYGDWEANTIWIMCMIVTFGRVEWIERIVRIVRIGKMGRIGRIGRLGRLKELGGLEGLKRLLGRCACLSKAKLQSWSQK